MAKQDLYKTAQQSAKLFKLIREGEELDSWVVNKITKAAADIESVYQYMNFEKHFKAQEAEINANTSLSESTKTALRNKLFEAKAKVAELKKKTAKEKAEKMDENAFDTKKGEMKTGDTKKTRTGVLTKTSTGVKHVNTSHSDEQHGEAPSKVKAQSAAEKKAEKDSHIKLPKDKNAWGMKDGKTFGKKVSESKAKCSCEDTGKAKCAVHGKKVEESKAKKNLPGNQEKLDANKNGKIEASDLAKLRNKKNVKEAIQRAKDLSEAKDKKAKKDWDKDGKIETGKAEHAGAVDAAIKSAKKETIKESTDLARMKQLMTRLNG